MNGDIYSWEESTDRGYSIGWNLETLIQKGMPNNAPPQTLEELFSQIQSLVQQSTYEWGGPVTLNSLDNYIAAFAEKEKPSKQGFITQIDGFFQKIGKHNVTISLDLIHRPGFMETEKRQVVLDAVDDVILDVYRSRMEKACLYPIIVVNLYPETSWDSTTLQQSMELSYLYGQPTYQNFITGTIAPETLRPRAYQPENEVTYLRLGGVNGDSEDQMVTGYACINLAKIGAEARDEEEFFELLDLQVDQAVDLLDAKHEQVQARFDDGDMPLTGHFLDNLDWGFSVITLAGMNEALETLIDAPLGHVAGKAVTYKVLEHLLRRLEDIHYSTGRLYSLESYPSENPAAELLEEYDTDFTYLTPATELKPSHGDDLWDVLEHQKKYHSLYTGGTQQQIHLKEGLSFSKELGLLFNRTIEVFGYNYLAISPVFSVCPEHGYVKGSHDCPTCGKKTMTYTRVDGKLTQISQLKEPQKEAYRQRVYYDVKNR